MNDDEGLVGYCYTKARRHRNVIGQWDGFRLWGGPYTVPQFVTMGVVLGLMVLTRSLWAHFGLLNILLLLALPYASSFLVRQMHIDGRNPFAAAASVVGLAAAGKGGHLNGRPLRRLRPQLLLGACTLTWRPLPACMRPAVRAAVPAGWPTGADHRPAGPGGGAVLSSAAALLAARRAATNQTKG